MFERWVWTHAHSLSRPPQVFAGRSDRLRASSDVEPSKGLQAERPDASAKPFPCFPFSKTLGVVCSEISPLVFLGRRLARIVRAQIIGRLQLPLITCFENTTLNLRMSRTWTKSPRRASPQTRPQTNRKNAQINLEWRQVGNFSKQQCDTSKDHAPF